jgi:hypothetical protein
MDIVGINSQKKETKNVTLQALHLFFLRNRLYIVWPKGELICRVMASQLYKGIQIIIHASREETKKERNINVHINRYSAAMQGAKAGSYQANHTTPTKSKWRWAAGHIEIRNITKSVLDMVVEGVAVAVVGEAVVGRRELLQALCGDGGEVAGGLGVIG